MASTSSPRKTPSARARVSTRPVVSAPVEAAEAPSVAETPDPKPVPASAPAAPAAPAPARKRAPRKTTKAVLADSVPDVPVPVAVEPVAVVAVAVDEVPEVAAPKPARRSPPRKTPARKKAAVSEPLPEPITEPITGSAPALVIEPVAEAVPPADPPPPLHSRVTLEQALCHRLCWTPGEGCPPALDAAGQSVEDEVALTALVRLARTHHHPLQVDPAVWDWLAQVRDQRDRIEHLERLHPAGPQCPALAALVTAPLRPYQAEAMLYAACAGRSLLADDAGLGKTVQAIAALRLIGQDFGGERALVLCPPERVAHWHAEWVRWTGTAAGSLDDRPTPSTALEAPITAVIAGLDVLADHAERLQALAADVVVVDEPAQAPDSPWCRPDLVAGLQRLTSPWALVLARSPLEGRPDAWRAMLDWIDSGRFGAVARLADVLVTPAVQTTPPGADRDALGPWMLRRSRTQVLRQLPETVEQTTLVALTPAPRAAHDTLLAGLHAPLRRWQRSQFLGSTEQRRLFQTLHTLRQCGHEQKTGPALACLDALLQPAEAKVVVFSQWPAHLDHLGAALLASGRPVLHLTEELSGEARRALVSEFQQNPAQRVLLCDDDERGGSLGLRHAATAILHLDRPWNPALLQQRLHRVHRTDRVRLVPVQHLVVQDSLESRLVQAQQSEAGRVHFVGLVEGPQAEVFLEGARLARFMSALLHLAQDATPSLPSLD